MMITALEATRRQPILDALGALDEEAWPFLVYQILGLAKQTGGFRDKAGWAQLRTVCAVYIKELQTPQ